MYKEKQSNERRDWKLYMVMYPSYVAISTRDETELTVFLSCTFLRYDVKPIVCAYVLKFLLSYLIINLICFGQWVLNWRYWYVFFLCSFAFFFLFTRWGVRKYILLIFTIIVTSLFLSYRVIAHTNVSFRISNSTKHRLAVRRRLMDVFFFDCTIFALKAHGVCFEKLSNITTALVTKMNI